VADSRLRELDRKWRTSGEVSDETALLLERLHQGQFSQKMLRLAAYCGHEASSAIIEKDGATPPQDLEDWVRGLAVFGKKIVVLSAVVSATSQLHFYENIFSDMHARVAILESICWLLESKESKKFASYVDPETIKAGVAADMAKATYYLLCDSVADLVEASGLDENADDCPDNISEVANAAHAISTAAGAVACSTDTAADDAACYASDAAKIAVDNDPHHREDLSRVIINYALNNWRDYESLLSQPPQ
jgi:hypothetical protein